ncbi:hypothetical protein JKF63_04799 [Porcisia hertigi]|uniref:Uncharacterized protein n=1 Tax=Porcisia hertigi TaxID=2761500 RepID=A0A836LDM1_9TRYP|nr:hypothetical protein JKF63_04799 [Porcisia hertigi]
MSCIPSHHTADEVDLLLHELQLRMTRAVESSPRLSTSHNEPHVLYAILADFFESKIALAQRSKKVALSAGDVMRVWAFCLAELASWSSADDTYTPNVAATSPSEPCHDKGPDKTLQSFVHSAPSLPLKTLQRGAPAVEVTSDLRYSPAAVLSSSLFTSSSEARTTSVFSIIQSSFAALMDLAYVVDQRLQRSSSSGAISVVSLAAVAASLVPTLDRVQAVRLTARIADDVLNGRTTLSDGSVAPPHSRSAVATLLAGVWYTWGVLDTAHTTALHSLGERLLHPSSTPACGDITLALPPPSFTAWLQGALRENNGALHQRLCVEAGKVSPPAKTGTEAVDAGAPAPMVEEHDTMTAAEDVAAKSEFWVRLAS